MQLAGDTQGRRVVGSSGSVRRVEVPTTGIGRRTEAHG